MARDRFGDWNAPDTIPKAADWTAYRREELLAAGAGVAFETVFSGPDKLDFVRRCASAGYFVRLFFVGTASPTINAARVAQRVMRGGHTVPIEKIVSRYARSVANLSVVMPHAHRLYAFDNCPSHCQHSYLQRGLYAPQVRQWMEVFGQDAVLFLKSEDFFRDPQAILDQVYAFLGMGPFVPPDLTPWNQGHYPALAAETRKRLQAFFQTDVDQVATLLGERFRWW